MINRAEMPCCARVIAIEAGNEYISKGWKRRTQEERDVRIRS